MLNFNKKSFYDATHQHPMTMRATSLLESDNTPSTFWITNRELELARACLRSPLSSPRLCER